MQLNAVSLDSGAQLAQVIIDGETDYTTPSIVVDAPTRHVFVADPSESTVLMFDATKL